MEKRERPTCSEFTKFKNLELREAALLLSGVDFKWTPIELDKKISSRIERGFYMAADPEAYSKGKYNQALHNIIWEMISPSFNNQNGEDVYYLNSLRENYYLICKVEPIGGKIRNLIKDNFLYYIPTNILIAFFVLEGYLLPDFLQKAEKIRQDPNTRKDVDVRVIRKLRTQAIALYSHDKNPGWGVGKLAKADKNQNEVGLGRWSMDDDKQCLQRWIKPVFDSGFSPESLEGVFTFNGSDLVCINFRLLKMAIRAIAIAYLNDTYGTPLAKDESDLQPILNLKCIQAIRRHLTDSEWGYIKLEVKYIILARDFIKK